MHGVPQPSSGPTVIGRYAIYDVIASGGMATVHLGRLVGPAGFSRTVAIKRLHPALAADQEIATMLLDEARLAARIQHPNVVPTLDVVLAQDQILLVMEYVRGDSLSRLIRAAQLDGELLPPNVVVAIMLNTLAGLHAAHEARDERGQPMDIVHRDVSPQNVIVGVDGIARVLDFGIAKAQGRVHTTKDGLVKGKVMYMSKEQLAAETVTRSTDIYAAGVILFEALTATRMFSGEGEMAAITRIIANDLRLPSQVDKKLAAFDAIVKKASALEPGDRYASARDMARALEEICTPASATVVGDWVTKLVGDKVDERARLVAEIERSTTHSRAAVELMDQPPSGVQNIRQSFTGPINLGSMLPPSTPTYAPMPFAPEPKKSSKSSTALVALALAGFLLLALIGIVAIVLSRRSPVVASVASAVTAPASAPTLQQKDESVRYPAPIDSSLLLADPADVPQPPPSSVAAPPAPRATPKAKPKCDPPYDLDAKGHKHFRPECM